jgi:1,4-dihydroxy-2-naphthoyl-CoA hydrolase
MQKLKKVPLEALNKFAPKTMMGVLGIEITAVGDDFIEGEMPVDTRTHQVYGLLHGGASVALAETLGSVGAALAVDTEKFRCVGIEINANHISSVTEGKVIGTAKPIHLGKSTHVWEIKIHSDQKKLVCISRLTVAIVPIKN